MKKIFPIGLMLVTSLGFSQKERTLEMDKQNDLISVTYYHDNGEVSQIGSYNKDGKLHGEWTSFDVAGNKIVSAKYDNGNKVGKWFFWSNNILKEVDYKNNSVTSITEWTNKELLATRN